VNRPIVVAGSTAPGEEAIIARAWLELRERFPDAALVIAPRHPARTPEIEQVLRDSGIEYQRASTLRPIEQPREVIPVLILDTFGELRSFYRRATVAFVGGSINPSRGGQNVAEPAACGTPVLFGPYYENQHEIATALLESAGAKIVHDAGELAAACARWLADPAARDAAGRRAREVAERAGGGARTSLIHLQALTAQG